MQDPRNLAGSLQGGGLISNLTLKKTLFKTCWTVPDRIPVVRRGYLTQGSLHIFQHSYPWVVVGQSIEAWTLKFQACNFVIYSCNCVILSCILAINLSAVHFIASKEPKWNLHLQYTLTTRSWWLKYQERPIINSHIPEPVEYEPAWHRSQCVEPAQRNMFTISVQEKEKTGNLYEHHCSNESCQKVLHISKH